MALFASNVALATIVCTYVLSFITVICIAIYVFVRVHLIGIYRLSLENISTSLAILITMGLVAQITWAVTDEGQGEHVAEVTRSQFELTAKSLLVSEVLWALVNTFMRLSGLLLLHSLFMRDSFRFQAIVLMWASIIHGIASLMSAVLICRPIQASWNTEVQGTCGNQTAAYVSLEVGGLLIDICILASPVYPILKLRLPLKQKILVLFVLSAGAMVTVITALRIAALHRINSYDFSYDQGYLGLLSAVGALLSIISCCAISLVPFVRYLHSIFPSRRRVDSVYTDQRLLFRFVCLYFKSKVRA